MKTKIILIFLYSFLFTALVFSQSDKGNKNNYGDNIVAGKFADVNGIKMYYEIYGKGEPLVLIHGNSGSIASMKFQIDFFSEHYKVIVADSRGHGKSLMGNQHFTYELLAEDWAELLNYLGISSAYVLGWSDGGIIGLLLASKYPGKIRKLAVMGANLRPDTSAVYPWAVEMVKRETKIVNEKLAEKDTTQNWKLQKELLGLLGTQPHISLDCLHKITAPVLVLSGDKDVIREEHTVQIYQNIPKAQLCIFPGETHLTPVINPKLFNETVYKFFVEPFSRPDTKDYFESNGK